MNDVPHTQLQPLPAAAASATTIDASQPPPLSPTTVVQVPPKKALTGLARQKKRQLNTCKKCGSKMTFRQVGANKVLVFCSSRNCLFPLDSEELPHYILPLHKVKNRASSLSLSFSTVPSSSSSSSLSSSTSPFPASPHSEHQQVQLSPLSQTPQLYQHQSQQEQQQGEEQEQQQQHGYYVGGFAAAAAAAVPQETQQDENLFGVFSFFDNEPEDDGEIFFTSRPT